MNKNFKRAISSILASAMAFSSMTIATVTTALPFTAVSTFAASTIAFDGRETGAALGSGVTSDPGTTGDTKSTSDGLEFNTRVKVTTEDTNYVEFTATGNFTLNVYGRAGGTGARNYLVKDSTGATVATSASELDKTNVFLHQMPVTTTATGAVTYKLTASKEISFYYIAITPEGETFTPLSNQPQTTETQSQTVTEPTTETQSQTVTEPTTETQSQTVTETATQPTTAAPAVTLPLPVGTEWQVKTPAGISSTIDFCEDGTLVYEDEYAQVYAAQKLSIQSSAATIGDRKYDTSFRTSKLNTNVQGANLPSGMAGSYRFPFKVVAKQAIKLSGDTNTASRNGIFTFDSGLGGTAVNPKAIDTCGAKATLVGEISAGTTVYIGQGGTDNSMFALDIQPGSTPVTVTTNVTVGGSPLANTPVKVNGTEYTTDAAGNVTFPALTTYTYNVLYTDGVSTFENSIAVAKDTTYPTSIALKQTASTVGLSFVDGTTPVAGKKVTLYYVDSLTPTEITAVTDANGAVSFPNLKVRDYELSLAGYEVPDANRIYNPATPVTAPVAATPLAYVTDNSITGIAVGVNSTNASAIFDSVQDAITAANDGDTIYVGPGLYRERLVINKNLTIEAVSGTQGTYKMPVITYADSASGSNSTGNRFHGDTVTISGTDVNVTFNDIRIENTAEADLDVVNNATALSSYVNGQNNTITLNNCEIFATRDTINTGKPDSDNAWTLNNCTVSGFQDVICGTGHVKLEGCTWDVNADSKARLFVPQANTADNGCVMQANDLTITNSISITQPVFLGRSWGATESNLDTMQVIVNGYTDENGIVSDATVEGAVDPAGNYLHGYEYSDASSKTFFTNQLNWLVRADQNAPYYTTNDVVNGANLVTANKTTLSAADQDEEGAFLFAGIVDSTLAVDDAITQAGFVFLNNDNTFKGTQTVNKVYTVGEGTDLNAVFYLKNLPASFGVKGCVEYKGDLLTNDKTDATVTVAVA